MFLISAPRAKANLGILGYQAQGLKGEGAALPYLCVY